MRFFWILLFYFSYSSVHAENDFFQAIQSISERTHDQSCFVNHVNVITGSFNYSATDFVIPGPRPIAIQRTITTSDAHHSKFDKHYQKVWDYNFRLYIDNLDTTPEGPKEYYYIEPEYDGDAYPRYLALCRKLKYERQIRHLVQGRHKVLSLESENEVLKGVPKELYPFLTNANGEISGKTNLKNIRFTDRVINGAGEQFIFAGKVYKHHGIKYRYDIISESISPSKYRLRYGYDNSKTGVLDLQTPTGVSIHSINFNYFKNRFSEDEVLSLISSNSTKQYVQYLQIKDNTYKVCRTGGPDEIYEFGKTTKIIRPEGRIIEVENYHPGINSVAGQIIPISKTHIDYRQLRVKYVKATTGPHPYPVITHQFAYHNGDKPGQGSFTHVYDAYNNLTSYNYDHHYRLTDIHRYTDKSYIGCYTEKFFWGKDDDEGNLKTRTAHDGYGNILMCKTYEYDKNGNVIRESLLGNLTGKGNILPILDESGAPIENGVEVYSKLKAYSNDGYNLLLEENDGRKKTIYHYLPNTNLLTHKFIYNEHQLCLRYFYFYDDQNLLKEEIWDDGSSEDCNDLSNVTERHIKRIYAHLEVPFGLPKVICETYYDVNSGQETWLNKVEYKYSPQGYIIGETHFDGNGNIVGTISRKFDKKGHVLEESNFQNEITEYRYDKNGNKIFEQGPNKSVYKEFVYDLANRLISEDEVHADGKRLCIKHRYDYMSRKIADVDIFGHETLYEYDSLGKLVKTMFPIVVDENNEIKCPIEKRQYNALGQLIAITDPLGETVRTDYNIRGQPTCTHYPNGTFERRYYTLDGLLEKVIQTNGLQTHYEYDYQGRLVSTLVYSCDGEFLYSTYSTYNAFHKISETDAMGYTTYYTYDAAGRLNSVRKSDSYIEYVYDAQSRLYKKKEHTEQGILVHITLYDCMNRIIEERTENEEHYLFSRTTYTYDIDGNCIQTIRHLDTGAAITSIEYNARKKPVTVTNPLGQTTRIFYYYDMRNAKGQRVLITEQIDPKGNAIVTEFNTSGKVAAVLYKNVFGEQTHGQRCYYDLKGRKKSTAEDIYFDGQYQRTSIYAWEYNNNDQITAKWHAYNTQDQKVIRYGYNNLGQQVAVYKPDGIIIHKEYDNQGRLSHYYSSDQTIDYHYEYDLNHNITQVSDSKGTTSRIYNALNQVIHEKLANNLSIDIEYDALCRPKKLSLPYYEECLYYYDEAHLRKVERKGSQTYHYDYTKYNLAGSLIEFTSPSGTTLIEYDALGRLQDINTPNWTEELAYDQAGNIVTSNINHVITSYSYDALYQLTEEIGTFRNSYQSDSIHNRIIQNGKKQTFNAHNQLVSNDQNSYCYDLNGNLIAITSPEGITSYKYDALDRLIEVRRNDLLAVYEYDAFNRRITKTVNGQKESFLYLEKEELGSYLNNTCKELRILGCNIGNGKASTLAIELNGKAYHAVTDHAGSIVQLQDFDGTITEQIDYSAFGEEKCNSKLSPWRFASKRYDHETDMIYFGERYYIPSQGRWLTEDPISTNDGPNLYAYLHNNPLIYVDRYGHMTEEPESSWWSSTWDYICNSATNCSDNIRENYDSLYEYSTKSWESCCKSADENYPGYREGILYPWKNFCNICTLSDDFYGRDFETRHNIVLGMATDALILSKCKLIRYPISIARNAYSYISGSEKAVQEVNPTQIPAHSPPSPAAMLPSPKRSSLVSVEKTVNEVVKKTGRSKNKFTPDELAVGSHTVFRRNNDGQVSHYETYIPQPNPRNPNKWFSEKRYDRFSARAEDGHYNRVEQKYIGYPHVHDPYYPGEVRYPDVWENPF